MGLSQEFMDQLNSLLSEAGYSPDSLGSSTQSTSRGIDIFADIENRLNSNNDKQDQDYSTKRDEELTPAEIVKKRREEKEASYEKNIDNPFDWVFSKLAQGAEGLQRMTGMEEAQAKIDKEGLNLGTAGEYAGAFLKSIPIGFASMPLDTATGIYEAATGTPIRESAGDKMAKYTLTPEQRGGALLDAAANAVGMIPQIGGTGRAIAEGGSLIKALRTGEKAAGEAWKAGAKAYDEMNFGAKLAAETATNALEGAASGVGLAIRGDEETKDSGENLNMENIGRSALQSGAIGAGMGAAFSSLGHLFGKARKAHIAENAGKDETNISKSELGFDTPMDINDEHSLGSIDPETDTFTSATREWLENKQKEITKQNQLVSSGTLTVDPNYDYDDVGVSSGSFL